MSDVLSQNEIDSLLAALSTGELDVDEIKENSEKQVKEYDFARPSKFSKEHLRTLEIIFEHYGRLLSTNLPDPNGKTLWIYSFNPKELKVETLLQTVEFNSQVARNAGGIIKINNNLYRPAQDCAKCYGNGVVIQKIEYNEGHFVFKDVNSIYPHSFRYNQGLHTLNNYKGLIVVDGRGYRNLIIGRILSFCFKFIGFR